MTRLEEKILIPDENCSKCKRLCDFRVDNKSRFANYHNQPVASFGRLDAELLVVGLAPGLHGANKSGRPFTGDYAGIILYSSLQRYGFAEGEYAARADDNFTLINARITNAVRCVPPENKPETSEIANCNEFLRAEIAAMPNLQNILSLGLISHNAVLSAFGLKKSAARFTHGATHQLGTLYKSNDKKNPDKSSGKISEKISLHNSYHCSRYNINTGRLTQEMFDNIVAKLR